MRHIFLSLIISVFLLSCTRAVDKSKLSIKLPSSNSSSQNVVTSSSPGVWGISDPTLIGQVSCYAILVGAPESEMSGQNCVDMTNTEKVRFGVVGGFYPAGSTIELDVPSGSQRNITLLGFASSSNSDCSALNGASPNRVNFSHPFILANKSLDLEPGIQNVSLNAQLDITKKLYDCQWKKIDTAPIVDVIVSLDPLNPVNAANETSYTFSGSCSEEGGIVDYDILGAIGSTTCSSGLYSFSGLDLSSFSDGPLNITINHTNASGVGNSITNVLFKDTVAPIVTIEQSGSQSDPSFSFPIRWDISFSEPIDLNTFNTSVITQSGTATGVSWNIVHLSDGQYFTLEATSGSSGGSTYIPVISASLISDLAGNVNAASSSTDNSVTLTFPGLLSLDNGPSYDFGTSVVGSSNTVILTLSNIGQSTATSLSETGLTTPFGFSGGSYPGTGGTCGATLAASATCTLNIEYAPSSAGLHADTVNIAFNDGVNSASTMRDLQGSATNPALLTMNNGPTFDYGQIATGGSSEQTFTVTNSGGFMATTLSGTGLAAPYTFKGGAFPGTGGTCSASLSPSASCIIVVVFSPPGVGVTSDTIQIDYFDGLSAVISTRNITGEGVAPATLTISDGPTFDYGNVTTGGSSSYTFTVSNSGGLQATSMTSSGLSENFNFLGGTYPGTGGTCGANLNAAANCTVVVEFAPVSTGLLTDTIDISYIDGAVVQNASRSIQGTGVAAAVINISESEPYDYGIQPIGSITSHTFTLTNSGASTATGLSGVGLAAPYSFQGGSYPGTGGTCGTTLAPASNCDIVVDFAPVSSTLFNDTIEIIYNDGANSQTSTRGVTAWGANPALLSIDGGPTFDFGDVTTGSFFNQVFTINNSGGVSATGMSGGGLGAPFDYVGGTYPGTSGTCGASLGPAASCTIEVKYSPVATVISNSTVQINYNDGVAAQISTRGVMGTGVAPAVLTISESDPFDYGSVAQGGSLSHIFTINNTGNSIATGISESGLAAPFSFPGGSYPGTGGTCGSTLNVGANCTIEINFSPGALGPFSDTLQIDYFDGAATQSSLRNVQGTGVNTASISISESEPFDFGNKPTGSATNYTFTLTNTGALAATSISGLGLAAPFSFVGGAFPGTGGTCTATLNSSANCTIVIAYLPVSTGLQVDTIQIDYDNGATTVSSTRGVQGTGVTPAVITISEADPYDYGSVVTGNFTDYSFTLTNIGGFQATSLSEVGLAAPFSFTGGSYPGTSGDCASTLNSGANCTIQVRFSPVSLGLVFGAIDISYNDGVNSQNSVRNIQGTGVTATPPPDPSFYASDITTASTIYSRTISVNISITGDTTATKWCLSESQSIQPTDGTATCNGGAGASNGWHTTLPTSFNLTGGDGLKFIYLWIADSGNTVNTTTTSHSIALDSTLPATPTASLNDPNTASATETNQSVVDLTITGDTDAAQWCVMEQDSAAGAPAAPLYNDGCWIGTKPTTQNLGALGNRRVYIYTKDFADNVSIGAGTADISYTTVAPVNPGLMVQDAVTSSTAYATATGVNLNIFSDTTAVRWCVSETQTTKPSIGTSLCNGGQGGTNGWHTTRPTSFSLTSGNGVKTVYLWVADPYNNVSSGVISQNITLDDVPSATPVVNVADQNTGSPNYTNQNLIDIVITSDTDAVSWCVVDLINTDPAPTAPAYNDACWVGTRPTSYNLAGLGIRTIYVRTKDVANNVSSAWAQATMDYSTTLPNNPSLGLSDQVTSSTTHTNSTNIDISIGSDTTAVKWCVSETQSTNPGFGTSFCNGGAGPSNGWFNTQPTTFVLSGGDGAKTIYIWIADNYNNVNAGPNSNSIILDTAAPSPASVTGVMGSADTLTDAYLSDISGNLTIVWTDSPNEFSYDIVVRDAGDTTDICNRTNIAADSLTKTFIISSECPGGFVDGNIYIARVIALDDASNEAISDLNFVVDTTAPNIVTINGITGGGDSTVDNVLSDLGSNLTINWADLPDEDHYEVVIRDASDTIDVCTLAPNVPMNNTNHSYSISSECMGGTGIVDTYNYIARITAFDQAGNKSISDFNFNVNGGPPPPVGIWTPTSSTAPPSARQSHTAIWTGKYMIVWGGNSAGAVNTGSMLNPVTDSWSSTGTTGAPVARYGHTSVWTGSRMLIWGGWNGSTRYQSGGIYDPETDTWTAMGETGLTSQQRHSHSAIWTGTEMIIWGGDNSTFPNTGFRYNPSNDTWNSVTTTGAPGGRAGHAAVWTGSEMLIWGGQNGSPMNSGARYNPGTDTWTAITTTGAPTPRRDFAYAWTGSRLIVWGGYSGSVRLDDGGIYDPVTNSWTLISNSLPETPDGRNFVKGLWTGTHFVVWGGINTVGAKTNTGGAYDPAMNEWRTIATTSAPVGRYLHTMVFTGAQTIVWGGADTGDLSSGGYLTPDAGGFGGHRISMGGGHACSRIMDGKIKCWGNNTSGQLGLEDTDHRGDQVSEMGSNLPHINIGTGKTSVHLEAGHGHTCAVTNDFLLKCWGENISGELGHGDTINKGDGAGEMGDSLPVVTGITSIKQVSVGLDHSCAVIANGDVYCWGNNSVGQVGDGTTTTRTTPVQVLGVGGSGYLTGVQQVSAGYDSSCALLSEGMIACWGSNLYGELGNGTTTSSNFPVAIAGGLDGFSSVKVGSSHACAKRYKELYCWGRNAEGQLGDGTTTDKTSPISVVSNSTGAYSVGNHFTCAKVGSVLQCTGMNNMGQLGRENTTNANTFGNVLSIGNNVHEVESYENTTCATYMNGDVKCWGDNTTGQLGVGDTNPRGDGAGEMSGLTPVGI